MPKITPSQRKALLEWVTNEPTARRADLNDRAALFDPPFEVDWLVLKQARQRAGVRIKEVLEDWEKEAVSSGLAQRATRIALKSERHDLLRQVIAERGEEAEMQNIPGGKTGLLVREYKGSDFRPVYKVDTGTLKEMRDLEREIAIELGQWTEKKELTGAGGADLLDPLVAALEKAYGNIAKPTTETD